jgi:alkylation response protein AidB-like acyl-CoA dehydrogenase
VHACLPVSEVVIHDTWHVSGLCGTGSNHFSAADIFVPEQRIFALLDPSGHRAEPLYQMPPLTLFVFQVVCVSLGIARSALDDLTELAQTKVPSLYTEVLAEKAVAQVELARAEAALGSARSANTLAGGSSLYSTSSLQRHARDAEAVTHHFTVAPHTWEEAGRVLLGREPNAPVF